MNYWERAKELKDEIISFRRNLHSNAEVGMNLPSTTEFVMKKLKSLGYEPTQIIDSGVVATIGNGQGPCILLRADMDALPIQDNKVCEYKSTVKGKMHACGHDGHTTILLGVAKLLNRHKDLFSGNDYSSRDYFKISMQGKAYMGSPVVSKVTGNLTLVVSAPIWENGVQGSKIVGVVTFDADKDFLPEINKNIKISENSYAYLIDNEGTTIADMDTSLIGKENTIKESATNPDLKDYAQADEKLISGKTGYANVDSEGQDWILGYAPVKNSNNWGVGIMVNKNDFLGQMYSSIIITIILAIVFTIAAFIGAIKFASKIGNPLKECSERL